MGLDFIWNIEFSLFLGLVLSFMDDWIIMNVNEWSGGFCGIRGMRKMGWIGIGMGTWWNGGGGLRRTAIPRPWIVRQERRNSARICGGWMVLASGHWGWILGKGRARKLNCSRWNCCWFCIGGDGNGSFGNMEKLCMNKRANNAYELLANGNVNSISIVGIEPIFHLMWMEGNEA